METPRIRFELLNVRGLLTVHAFGGVKKTWQLAVEVNLIAADGLALPERRRRSGQGGAFPFRLCWQSIACACGLDFNISASYGTFFTLDIG
jgi:hypothetical protein